MEAKTRLARDLSDLRAVYPMPTERVATKVLPRLGEHMREFIALSPFAVVATVGEGGKIDASPRGDTPGFVRVLDQETLVMPDWPGNNRIDSSQNLVADSHIGTIFFVPGVSETLRINGRARITFDGELLATMGTSGKLPERPG
jgi:PPOX class probable FMN-dependent enzyme